MEPITGFATAIAILKNLNDLMASAGESVPREVLDQVRALQTELLAAQQRESTSPNDAASLKTS